MARAAAALLLLPLACGLVVQVKDDADAENENENATADNPEASPAEFEKKANDPKYWTVTGPAAGDPKLQGLYGKRFQIHKPGDYQLLTVPNEKKKHGDHLHVEAEVKELEIGDPCLLFIKKITVAGSWLGEKKFMVRAQGSGVDFAMRVDHKGRAGEGVWRPFKNMTGWEEPIHKDPSTGYITTVKGVIGRREGHSEDIKGPHEHRFLIRVQKEDQKTKPFTIDIAQPKPGRQFLTVKVEHVKPGLGDYSKTLQGLLGLDSKSDTHPALTVRDDCKDSQSATKATELLALSGGLSRASAHWE